MSAVPLQRPRQRPGAAPPRRHLRVVPEPRRRHTPLFALVYLAVLAVIVFGTVTINALAAGDAVRTERLEREVADQERQYTQLVADIARLEDPARIEQAAAELGMVRGESPRQLVVERTLPGDRPADDDAVVAGGTTDPLKPVLSAER